MKAIKTDDIYLTYRFMFPPKELNYAFDEFGRKKYISHTAYPDGKIKVYSSYLLMANLQMQPYIY